MKTFESIYPIVDQASHETAFRKDEAEKYYDLIMGLKKGANIVEIGVEYGRSTSVLGEISKSKDINVVCLDNYKQDNSPEAESFVRSRIENLGWNIKLLKVDSSSYSKKYRKKVDLIFIDGDHEEDGVLKDIDAWLPKVKKGGYILFHDYGRDSLVGPYKAVSSTKGIKYIETVYTLGVFKKL